MSVKLIFAGSYLMSAELLNNLCNDNRFSVSCIITAPSQYINHNPVLDLIKSQQLNIKYYAPQTLVKNQEIVLNELDLCDILLSCSYALRIPKWLRDKAKKAALNLHPSLLPKYRGPNPIRRAILDERKETGITLHKLVDEYDAGPIYMQWKQEISGTHDCGSLTCDLSRLASNVVPDAVYQIAKGKCKPSKQDESKATHALRFKDSERIIESVMLPTKIDYLVRANFPWNPAYILLNDQKHYLAPGTVELEKRCDRTEVILKNNHLIILGPHGKITLKIIDPSS